MKAHQPNIVIIIRSRSEVINRTNFGNPFVSARRFSCIPYFHECTKELELHVEAEVLQWFRAGWKQWGPCRQSTSTQQSPAKAAEGRCLQSRSLAGSAIAPTSKLGNRRLWLNFWDHPSSLRFYSWMPSLQFATCFTGCFSFFSHVILKQKWWWPADSNRFALQSGPHIGA